MNAHEVQILDLDGVILETMLYAFLVFKSLNTSLRQEEAVWVAPASFDFEGFCFFADLIVL